MFYFLSFLMSFLHSIPFKHAIHFLACITLDLISLSSVPCMIRGHITGWMILTAMVERTAVKNSRTLLSLLKGPSSHHTSVNSHPLTPHDAPKWWRRQLQPAVFIPLQHPDRPTQNPIQRLAVSLPQKVKEGKLLSWTMRGAMPPIIRSAMWTVYLSKGINMNYRNVYSLRLQTNISEYIIFLI